MDTKTLYQIKLMLAALLKSSGQLYKIGAYAPGRTATGAAFLVLYDANPKLQHKICRIYQEQFSSLPDYVDPTCPQDAQEGNPDRDKAKKAGILKTCKPFNILTVDGKQTSLGAERRFFAVL